MLSDAATFSLGAPGPHDAREIAELLDLAPVGALVRTLEGDVITYWSHGVRATVWLDKSRGARPGEPQPASDDISYVSGRHGAFAESNGPVVW